MSDESTLPCKMHYLDISMLVHSSYHIDATLVSSAKHNLYFSNCTLSSHMYECCNDYLLHE